MSFQHTDIHEFNEILASKAPVPGGGGASALAASLGAALGSMVANLTVGKKKYAGYEAELSELLADLESLRIRAEELIDADADDGKTGQPAQNDQPLLQRAALYAVSFLFRRFRIGGQGLLAYITIQSILFTLISTIGALQGGFLLWYNIKLFVITS